MTQEIQGSILVDDQASVQHTGAHRFTGGSKFVIADATDASKTMVFNLSGLTTGTETEFTVPESDSSIVTLSATQTLTNKKLSDSTCTFADNTDATKQLAFQCSGITTGTTRTVTAPNSDGTIAYLAGSTLTTAVLTDPTVNAGGGTVVLPGANPPAQTAEGSIVWDTVNDLLTVGDGSSRKTMVDLGGTQTLVGKTLTSPTINGGTFTRTAQAYGTNAAGNAKVGATAGWVVAAADNIALVTLPASQTASTLVLPITGLKVGWTITGFYLVGQIESAGGAATLDADLRIHTAAAGDVSDASLGAIAQVSVTEDTAVTLSNTNKTLATPNQVTGANSYYVLITGTTAALTDIALQGVYVTVTEA